MPLDYRTKLNLLESDPEIAIGLNNRLPAPDEFLSLSLGNDYQKYIEMRRDPQIRSKLGRRVRTILGRRMIVETGGNKRVDRKAVELAEHTLERIGYESICSALLGTGMLIGFSVMRIDWEEQSDKIVLPKATFVRQERFCFVHHDPENVTIPVCTGETLDPKTEIVLVQGYELRLLTKKYPFTGERCPKSRFLCYTFDGEESPWGLGIGYSIYPWYVVKKHAMQAWLLQSDRVGAPPVLGNVPASLSKTPDNERAVNDFKAFLKAVSPQAWASLPLGFEAKLLDGVSSASPDLHKDLIQLANDEISKITIGDIPYSEKAVGGYAANSSQVEDRESSLVDGDCNLLDEQLRRQLWEPFFAINAPDAALPTIRREARADIRKAESEKEQEAALKARIDRDKLLLELGIRLKPEAVAEAYGADYFDTSTIAAEEEGAPAQQALFSQLGVGGTQALVGFVTGFAQSGLGKDNAIALLKTVFGLPAENADAILPDVEEAPVEGEATLPDEPATPEQAASVDDLLDQDFAEPEPLDPIDWLVESIQRHPPENSIDWLAQQIYQHSEMNSLKILIED